MTTETDFRVKQLEDENAKRKKLHDACTAASAKLDEALKELVKRAVSPDGSPLGVNYYADLEPVALKIRDAMHEADAMAFYSRPITLEGPYAIDSTDAQDRAALKTTRLRLVEAGSAAGRLTCEDCDGRKRCEYAFEGYNTDGDCLATK